MQIIEQSIAGVRSAVLRLTRRETPLRFELYPMVHIGEPAFYAAVSRRLRRCDLVVAEGVGSTSAGSLLTMSYRLPARFERSGLVVEDIDYASLGVPVLNPDLSGAEFEAGWRELPPMPRVRYRLVSAALGPPRSPLGFLLGDLLVRRGSATATRRALRLFPDADHSLHVPRRSGRTDAQVLDEALDAMATWIAAP